MLAPIALGECKSGTISSPGEVDAYTFSAAANDVILLAVADTSSYSFTPYASLYNPAGSLVKTVTYGHKDLLTIPTAGTYTIQVYDYFHDATGNYLLCLEGIKPSSPDAVAIQRGDTKSGTMASAAEMDPYVFTAAANDVVTLTVADTSSYSFTPYADLYTSAGSLVGTVTYGHKQVYTLPAAGTYTILVYDYFHDETGDYTIDLQGLKPSSLDAVPIQLGDTTSGSIGVAGEVDSFVFTSMANGVVTLTVADTSSYSFTPRADLYSPSQVLVEPTVTYGHKQLYTLTEAGTYTIQVYDYFHDAAGNYIIDLQGISPPSLDALSLVCSQPQSGSIGVGVVDEYLFYGEQNDVVTLTVADTSSYSFTPRADLYSSTGSPVGTVTYGHNAQYTLPATGTYVIQLYDYFFDAGGSYNFTLQWTSPVKGCIAGQKFNDLDGDGLKELGENGLQGWTVFLDANNNGTLNTGERSTVTDILGNFCLTSLAQGSYRVREVPQSGWQQTNPATGLYYPTQPSAAYDVTLSLGQVVTGEDFGNTQKATISGLVWNDANGDGMVGSTSSEPPLSGWTVYLDTNNNGVLNSGEPQTTTRSDGWYRFIGLDPGTYKIREVLQYGWQQTRPTGGYYTVTLTAAQWFWEGYFGNRAPPPGFTVTPTAGLVTTEIGGTATFTVKLNTQPTANVSVGLSSSDTTEGTVYPTSLTFTTSNWSTEQTVTVTGVDDWVDDGDIGYTIVTAAASSSDPNYSGLNPTDVSATNVDNDTAGFTVTPTSGLITSESGGTATFTVKLNSQPTANVTVGLSSSDTTEGTVSPTSLTFMPSNWSTEQTVTVTGVPDSLADGDIGYTIITAAATSSDPNYSGLNPPNVSVTNLDGPPAGFIIAPTSGLVTTENGGTATFTVKLSSQPMADVTVGLSSSDTTEGNVFPTSLTFTTSNWNFNQTVTVTGVDDPIDDDDIAYTITTAAATSSDPMYSGLNPSDVSATNLDNDVAGFTVSCPSGLATTEDGGSATCTIKLNTQPTAGVTVPVSSSDTTEGSVSPASLTFTASNWSTVQAITISGVDDLEVDGDITYTVIFGPAISSDPKYHGKDPPDCLVINVDNEPPGAPEIRAELRLVSVPAASDHLSDASFASYASLSSVPANSTYYAEVWLRDAGTIRGIAGGGIDLSYTTSGTNATVIEHGGVYTVLTSGAIDDANGLVDNLGGGTINTGAGTTQWVRLGTTTFQGAAAGAVTFTLGHDLSPGAVNSRFAEVGAGNLDWSLVQFPASPLTLQQLAGSVEVYLVPRLVKSAADTSVGLPTSERSPFWALEGGNTAGVNDFFVEVWVRSDPANPAGISGGSVNLSFDRRYVRAVAIDHGSVYTLLPVESINNTTGLVSLGGGTLATDKGRDGYVLLGRVEFQGDAPVDEVTHQAGPYSVGLASAAGPNSFALVGLGNVDAVFKPVPTANIKAVTYDIDDSGTVDFGDFSYFVPAFGKPVGGTEPPYTWWADVDDSGSVDFGDFSYFVTAFNKVFSDPSIQFPDGGGGTAGAAGGEAEGLARFLAAARHPWQNPQLAADVNGRDGVTPIDALLIANYIDQLGSGVLPEALPSAGNPSMFLDVNGDDAVTALDLFAVCDYLNGGGHSPAGEGEGGALALSAAAESDIETALRLVTSPFAGDRMSDANFESYVSVTAVPPNSTFYAEVWLRDRGTIRGIAGGTVDLAYTTAHADATAINHGSIFNVLTSGTINDPSGLVDNLGGGTFNSGEGTTQWVRLVTTTFQAVGAGATTFTLGQNLPPGAANPTFAEVGAGNINDWNLIQFNGTPTTVTSRLTLSDDIVGRNQYGYLWVAKSNGSNAFSSSIWGQWSTARTWKDVLAGDFNGDGRDDVVARNEFGYWWVAASNGSNGFSSSIWGKWDPTRTWTNVMVGDFNGDGRDDLVGRNQFGYWWVATSNGAGSFSSAIWGKWDTARTWTNVMVGDFNADGRSDLVARNEYGYWWVAASNGSNGFSSSIWGKWDPTRTWSDVMVGDFNADGADDVIGRNQFGYWWVAASNGSNTLSNAIWGQWSTARTWTDVLVGDFDGNGAADVVGRNDYGYWWVAKSNGTDALTNGIWGQWDNSRNWVDVMVGDFNDDGHDDVVGRDKFNYWWVQKSNGRDQFANEYWGKWNAVDWFDVLGGDFGT